MDLDRDFGRVEMGISAGWGNRRGHVLGVVNPMWLFCLGLDQEQGARRSNGQVVGRRVGMVVVAHGNPRYGGSRGEKDEEFYLE